MGQNLVYTKLNDYILTHVVLNLYDVLSSVEHKRRNSILKNVVNQTVWVPFDFFWMDKKYNVNQNCLVINIL